MLSTNLKVVFVFGLFYIVQSQRRIKDGSIVENDQRYVVYLVRALSSPRLYDEWLCGGALVSTWFIVTSAACVQDVQHMYAIAGYKVLVESKNLDNDECTKEVKKKIVYTCVPKAYDFAYDKVEKWAFIDIAAVKVESEYNFQSPAFAKCSYQPSIIPINYEPRLQEAGVDAMVLGWGHVDKWRQPNDSSIYNQNMQRFAAVRLHDKNECKNFFSEIGSMSALIERYMVCSLGAGNINDKGDLIMKSKPIADGCTPNIARLMRGEIACEEDEIVLPDFRKTFSNILERQQNMSRSRRQGFCQNDHGGPLVTWVGTHVVLIGVASVFRVTEDSLCTGPYLYTSTQCNGAFLDCVINDGKNTITMTNGTSDPTTPRTDPTTPRTDPATPNTDSGKKTDSKETPDAGQTADKKESYNITIPPNQNFSEGFYYYENNVKKYAKIEKDRLRFSRRFQRDICNEAPSVKGFDKIERHISWLEHPEGPSHNELLMMRPQVPISVYNVLRDRHPK